MRVWLKRAFTIVVGLLTAVVLLVAAIIFWPTVISETTYQKLQSMTASPQRVRLLAYRDINDPTVIGSADLSPDNSKKVIEILRSGRFFFPGSGGLKCEAVYRSAIEFSRRDGDSDRVLIDSHCIYFRVEGGADEEMPQSWRLPIATMFLEHKLPLNRGR